MRLFISTFVLFLLSWQGGAAQSTQLADKFPGSDAGEKLAAAIAALPASGGTVDARNLQGEQTISKNFFAGVGKPGKLLLGAATYTISVRLVIPNHWEIAGVGPQTVLRASNGLHLPAPEGLLANASIGHYQASSGHDTDIVIHDLTIDANAQGGARVSCITVQGIDDSQFFGLTLRNFTLAGFDLRDGLNNTIHDNFADGASSPQPYHSFGGGVALADGIFRGNRFLHNRSVNGIPPAFDAFDINGNHKNSVCEDNEISDNTCENAPAAIFIDSCAKTTVRRNRIVGASNVGIAATSGLKLAQQNEITGNEISQAGIGILLGFLANQNVVTNNDIELSAKEGIVMNNAYSNQIENNTIKGPGQSGTFAGIIVTEKGPYNAGKNTFSGNHIVDAQQHMVYGILLQNVRGGAAWRNVVTGNIITGGQPGNTGRGVHDEGKINSVSGGEWSR